MNMLGCLDRPSSGRYLLDGRDVGHLSSNGLARLRRQVFGFVFQSYNLLANATAKENVVMPAIYAGTPHTQRSDRACRFLSQLGLGDRMNHRPSQLSGGEQQRVAVARALMNDAQVILADEPTGALDSQSGEELLDLLAALAQQGHTVIVITHDPSVAEYADRKIELLDGRVLHDSGSTNQSGRNAASATRRISERFATVPSWSGLWEASRMAFRSLRANLFRTCLTLLGVVIGVTAVVIMLAIGEGARVRLVGEIDSLGANILTIWPDTEEYPAAELTFDDADAIAELHNVKAVLPELSGLATVRYGNVNHEVTISATAPQSFEIRGWKLASGTFFSRADSESYTPVVVLGSSVTAKLFNDGIEPLGKYILIKKVPFLVIGTMMQRGASAFEGGDRDQVIFVPLKTGAMRLFGETSLGGLQVAVKGSEAISDTEAAVSELLNHRHGDVDFWIRNSTEMQESMGEAMSIMTLILGSIGGITLLVGGIGIMNIMLVSVTERTREIGIRMATGARQSDILAQFLVESMVVSGFGGVFGILIGTSIGFVLGAIFPILPLSFTGMPMAVAFACALTVGVIFGFTPARNAARLDPVLALAG
jgi:macrolide transport system ATP-binding/permease protein